MRESTEFKVPRWPFFLGDAFMLGLAYFIYWQDKLPLSRWEIVAICICVSLGALLGVLPFLLEYRVLLRLIQSNALGTVAEKISNLEHVAAQISSATNQWETTHEHAEKVAATAKEISERMAAEVCEFTQFMEKLNESEKGALRLEVEKLHRAETDWLQVLVRVLDHIFALHTAALRSGQPQLIEQLTQFQNACRDAARRVGLTPFVANDNEPFDSQRHQWVDGDGSSQPPDGAVVTQTVAAGYTFQGKLVRPAAVRVQQSDAVELKQPESGSTTRSDQNQLPLEPASPTPN